MNLSIIDLSTLLYTDVQGNITAVQAALDFAVKIVEATSETSPLYAHATHRVNELRGMLAAQHLWAARFDEIFLTDHVVETLQEVG